jgi:CRISPR-associated protein Csx10
MSELALALRQPAQVGDRARSDLVLSTHGHIPGSVVRGAFAAAWIAAHGEPGPGSGRLREEFLRLFEGPVRFGPLFCGEPPTPLSVLGHKYPAGDGCAFAQTDRATDANLPDRCPDCGSPMEPVTALGDQGGRTRRRTSVAIGAGTVAISGMIVTRDTLEEGQVFRGHLIAEEPELLDALSVFRRVRVGGRRTTHGAADVAVDAAAEPPPPQVRDDGRVVIRLRSPGVFVDDWGRPSRDPNLAELAELLGSTARVKHRWARWQAVGGWHVASGLPKPTELAVPAGSTYVVETERPPDEAALAALSRRGLGLRRHEGFGDVGGAPSLLPGRIARQAESDRLRAVVNGVAALRGLPVTRRDVWPQVSACLIAHARGDDAVAGGLLGPARNGLDARECAALDRFLTYDGKDAAHVLEEWGIAWR